MPPEPGKICTTFLENLALEYPAVPGRLERRRDRRDRLAHRGCLGDRGRLAHRGCLAPESALEAGVTLHAGFALDAGVAGEPGGTLRTGRALNPWLPWDPGAPEPAT